MGSQAESPIREAFAIETAAVFDGERLLGPRRVEIADGRIEAVLDGGTGRETRRVVRLPLGVLLCPGFIDIQANGGGDVLLNDDPSAASIRRIAAAHRRFGTTGLLPTLITDHREKLRRLAESAEEALRTPGVLGLHLEGPHINAARQGIHPAHCIRPLAEPDMELLLTFAARGRSLVTLAPEMVPADRVSALVASGLSISAGHTDAAAGQILAAVDSGLTGVTHLFNAMSQMTPREPGTVGAALGDDRLTAGIICDGVHVAPLNLRIAYRAMGAERLMLVTDAMPTAGGRRSFFRLHDRRITLHDGRLTDEHGTLAGAHLTMNEAVRNAVGMMGASLADALAMASTTPARFLGLGHALGRIAPGYHADLCAIDGDFAISGVWIGGEPAFEAGTAA